MREFLHFFEKTMTIHRNDSEGSFGSDNNSSSMTYRNRAGDGSPPMFELEGSIEDVSFALICILCRIVDKMMKF